MRIAIALVLTLASTTCLAGAGMPCEKIEYAQLKDSTKKELTENYCTAVSRAQLNADLRAVSLTRGADKEISERGEAQMSCLGVADDVASMLQKKFKSKPPACK